MSFFVLIFLCCILGNDVFGQTLEPTLEPTESPLTPVIAPTPLYTDDEINKLNKTFFVTGLISFISSLIVVGTIIVGTTSYIHTGWSGIVTKKLSFHLILCLSIADVIRSIKVFFGSPKSDSVACGCQLFFSIFGSTLTFMWIVCISYSMERLFKLQDMNMSRTKKKHKVMKLKAQMHSITWFLCFLLALIPTASKAYQNQYGTWCWFSNDNLGHWMEIFCYFIWFVLTIVIILLLYCRIFYYFTANTSKDIPTIDRLLWFPMGFFLVWSIVAFQNTWDISNLNSSFTLLIVSICFGNLYGLGNLILFAYMMYQNINLMNDINEAKANTYKLQKQDRQASELETTPGNITVDDGENDEELSPRLKGVGTARIKIMNDATLPSSGGDPITVEASVSEAVTNGQMARNQTVYYNEDIDFTSSDDDNDNITIVKSRLIGVPSTNDVQANIEPENVQLMNYNRGTISHVSTFDDDDVNNLITEIEPIQIRHSKIRVINGDDETTVSVTQTETTVNATNDDTINNEDNHDITVVNDE